jgi:hypothetical protein
MATEAFFEDEDPAASDISSDDDSTCDSDEGWGQLLRACGLQQSLRARGLQQLLRAHPSQHTWCVVWRTASERAVLKLRAIDGVNSLGGRRPLPAVQL